MLGASGTDEASSPRSGTRVNRSLSSTDHTIGSDIRMSQPESILAEPTDRNREDDINYVKQLSEFQVAVIQHPLHDDSLTGQAHIAPSARIADLQLGRLFALTVQLRGATEHLLSLEGVRNLRQVLKDNAAVQLALSCYVRLDYVYSRAVDVLRDIQRSGQKLDDSYQLMSGFAIDGFSLGACQEFQLSFVMQLCEQIRQKLAATMVKLRRDSDCDL